MIGALARAFRGRCRLWPASMDYSDASWRQSSCRTIGHRTSFDAKADGSHGFKALGSAFPQNSVSWYRRTFDLAKADANRRLWLEFDGVFRDCTVFVNGWFVGHHDSGYTSFRYDITDVAKFGERNLVAVRSRDTARGMVYEGAGIYRHVWLVKTAPVAMAPDVSLSPAVSRTTPRPVRPRCRCKRSCAIQQPAPASVVLSGKCSRPTARCVRTGRKLRAVSGAATTHASIRIARRQA